MNNVLTHATAAAFIGCLLEACSVAPQPSELDAIGAVSDRAVIERGRYLVYGPAHCADCHGEPDIAVDPEGAYEVALSGGKILDLGALGTLSVPNITSDPVAGIGAVSDATLVRSLRYGVARDGRPLLPFMPFADMTDADLQAVLSFLRAVPPSERVVPKHDLSVLGKAVVNFALKPEVPSQPRAVAAQPQRTAEYGRYLAHTVANCYGCHTQRSRLTGAFIGPPFAGGMKFEEGTDTFVAPNLTPIATGLVGAWSEQEFIGHFRRRGEAAGGSPMPWASFARMTDDDLGAIYRYLRTTEPAETPQ